MSPATRRVRVRIAIAVAYLAGVAYPQGAYALVLPADARALIAAGHAVETPEE